jgi:hemoglobin/transferrin/lactoferrin receptor protein
VLHDSSGALPHPTCSSPRGGWTFLGTILLDPDYLRASDPNGNAADRIKSQYVADAELDRARMGDLKDLFRGFASVSVGGGIPIAQKIFVNSLDMLKLGHAEPVGIR